LHEENKDPKRNLEIQNTNLEKVKQKLLLIRENLGKRPIESPKNQMIDNLVFENPTLRTILSQYDFKGKSLDLLIINSRNYCDKTMIGYNDKKEVKKTPHASHNYTASTRSSIGTLSKGNKGTMEKKLTLKDQKLYGYLKTR